MKTDIKYSNQRVGIFVDVQNLYHSAKNLYHGRVNYTEMKKHLVGDRQLIRAMAYVVKSEGVEPQRTSARTDWNADRERTTPAIARSRAAAVASAQANAPGAILTTSRRRCRDATA